jgi:hypothetical protein
MRCLYFVGLNLLKAHMAKELDLNQSDLHQLTCQLRRGMVAKKPAPTLTDEVEGDEVSIVAGHTGKPDEVAKKGGADGADGFRASGDGARLPPRSRRCSG